MRRSATCIVLICAFLGGANAQTAVADPPGVSHKATFEEPKPLKGYEAYPLPAVKASRAARRSSDPPKPVGRPDAVEPESPVGGPRQVEPRAHTGPDIDAQEEYYPYDTTKNPARQVGRLFFTLSDGKDRHCSGSLVNAANQSTVLTAAHCLYTAGTGWIRSAYFCPGFNSGTCKLGRWPARLFAVETPWFTAERHAYDVGIVLLEDRYLGTSTRTRNCKRFKKKIRRASTSKRKRQLRRKFRRCKARGPIVHQEWRRGTAQSVAGGQGIAFNRPVVQTVWAFGYPVTDSRWPGPKYDPNYLTWCPQRESTYVADHESLLIWCGMTGGSSGGPWIVSPDDNWLGYVNSVQSHGPFYWAREDCTEHECPVADPLAVVTAYGPYFAAPERDFYYQFQGS